MSAAPLLAVPYDDDNNPLLPIPLRVDKYGNLQSSPYDYHVNVIGEMNAGAIYEQEYTVKSYGIIAVFRGAVSVGTKVQIKYNNGSGYVSAIWQSSLNNTSLDDLGTIQIQAVVPTESVKIIITNGATAQTAAILEILEV